MLFRSFARSWTFYAARASFHSGWTAQSRQRSAKRCLELLNRDAIPALREHGKNLGLVSLLERAPGSRRLGPDGVYAAVSNPEALADE